MLPDDPKLRAVLIVLFTLVVVALFAVADNVVRAGLVLILVFGGFLAFEQGRK